MRGVVPKSTGWPRRLVTAKAAGFVDATELDVGVTDQPFAVLGLFDRDQFADQRLADEDEVAHLISPNSSAPCARRRPRHNPARARRTDGRGRRGGQPAEVTERFRRGFRKELSTLWLNRGSPHPQPLSRRERERALPPSPDSPHIRALCPPRRNPAVRPAPRRRALNCSRLATISPHCSIPRWSSRNLTASGKCRSRNSRRPAPDSHPRGLSGATATIDSLKTLLELGDPNIRNRPPWTPHRPPRPDKSEGGRRFRIVADYVPKGDQPTAIAELVKGVAANERDQVLLGVTGSGKTFTMAKVIEATQRPALILAPNKTLAAQLYGEFRSFFPDNAVEYFVSYYDYYQPEAYVPRTDTYIEKESDINEQIDRMRHAATRAVLERDDVIIVASVSCIYGIGSVETYTAMTFSLKLGDKLDQRQLIADLVALQYKRSLGDFARGVFRVRGDTIEIFPAHYEDRAWRIGLFGDEIEAIVEFDPLTGQKTADLEFVKIYANSHYVTPAPDAAAVARRHQVGAEDPARRAQPSGAVARGAAARAAHHLRPRNAGGDRLLRRHRELFALSHRPPSRRAAADPVRIPARQRPHLRRREPCDDPADRRHVSRRLPAQGDARRIRLSPALLHGQPAAALRGMGRHAAADRLGFGDARTLGARADRRRLRRAGDPPDRPDRPAGRGALGAHARSTTCSPRSRRWRSAAIARWSPR